MATVRIKDPWREKRLFETRVVFAGAIIFLMSVTLVGQLYRLQIVRHDYYAELANGNRVRTEPVPAPRGILMDRHGELIANSKPTYQLELVPEDTVDDRGNSNIKDTLASLSNLGLIPAEKVNELQRTIRAHRSFDSVPLLLHMSDEEVGRFAVNRWRFHGVNIETRQTRAYPNGELAVHALGYVSSINEQDLEQIDRSAYAGTSLIGKLGVEQRYEKQLHGRDGAKDVLVNAAGRAVVNQSPLAADLKETPPVAGEDLYLSLDLTVQRAAEQGLKGHQGAVVALDPNNGDILALASLPGFDPTLFSQGITATNYRTLQQDPAIPLLNRALRGAYPPGSTVKPMLALAGLTYHTIDPERKFVCIGQFHVPGSSKIMHEFHNDKHGTLTLDDAVIRSCDSYFYTVAEVMGIDRMSSFMGPFGYGSLTGIDISGEKPGTLPSREWKAHAFKRAAEQIWFPGETVNMGVGQGYLLVTPIQQAHYAAIMAMHGKSWRPRLVTAYRDENGKVHQIPPHYDHDVTDILRVSPEDWERIRNDMVGVTTKPPPGEGTAYLAFSACQPTVCTQPKTPYTAGGKTGTAQVYSVQEGEKYDSHNEELRDHSWFIAFAPADRPRIAVAVIVEHGGSGAGAAAPIARKVLDSYLLDQDGKLKPAPDEMPGADTNPAAAVPAPAPANVGAERKAQAPVAPPTASLERRPGG